MNVVGMKSLILKDTSAPPPTPHIQSALITNANFTTVLSSELLIMVVFLYRY